MKENRILAAREAVGAPLQSRTRPAGRLLVVDDDSSLRRLSAEVLSISGYTVDVAEDGAAAWEVLNTDSYDLMITDNNMPNLSGVELLKKLHAARLALPVIMATGKLPEEEFAQYPWLQPAATLLKPYTVDELLGTVDGVLRKAEGAVAGFQQFKHHERQDEEILPVEKTAGVPPQHLTNARRRILVVDDDSDTRQLSVDVLAGSGYTVEAVLDGAAGWEALQDHCYDLIITDNTMPRMTGMEMIEKLRSARMAVPVIMATGHLPLNEFARKPWLQPDAMLQRPFSNGDLLETVKTVLHPGSDNDGGKAAPVPQHF
jgi:DNA-binding response OmpR family regulator